MLVIVLLILFLLVNNASIHVRSNDLTRPVDSTEMSKSGCCTAKTETEEYRKTKKDRNREGLKYISDKKTASCINSAIIIYSLPGIPAPALPNLIFLLLSAHLKSVSETCEPVSKK